MNKYEIAEAKKRRDRAAERGDWLEVNAWSALLRDYRVPSPMSEYEIDESKKRLNQDRERGDGLRVSAWFAWLKNHYTRAIDDRTL